MLALSCSILVSEQGLFFVSQCQDLFIEDFCIVTDCCRFTILLAIHVNLVCPFVASWRQDTRGAVIQLAQGFLVFARKYTVPS